MTEGNRGFGPAKSGQDAMSAINSSAMALTREDDRSCAAPKKSGSFASRFRFSFIGRCSNLLGDSIRKLRVADTEIPVRFALA
jgi:hypothetical protein